MTVYGSLVGPADSADDEVAVLGNLIGMVIVAELDIEYTGFAILSCPGDGWIVVGMVRCEEDMVIISPPAAFIGFIEDVEIRQTTGDGVFFIADGNRDIHAAFAFRVGPWFSVDFDVIVDECRAVDFVKLMPALKGSLSMMDNNQADAFVLQKADEVLAALLRNILGVNATAVFTNGVRHVHQ